MKLKQDGYTLVLVLLVVLLIGILAPVMMSKIVSSKLQIQKTEQKIQLEKLRQMGVEYMESTVAYANNQIASEPNPIIDNTQYMKKLQEYLRQVDSQFGNEVRKVLKKDDQQFIIKINSTDMVDEDNIILSYTVTASITKPKYQEKESNEEVMIHIVKQMSK
ncbi:hypothetical protein H9659_12250 [Sporosarcina sp. Sa3CUA8]|uniref:Type II secretion system protein n=2 Tax=Sporosarcina gallistercoris TaxID=2762245 RepID=A0ABR8PLR3_9BACL|nr:hypothetical protein [Sporosarcina gallistercoris]